MAKPVTILDGTLTNGGTVRICVPEGWSGRVGLLIDVHRGSASRRVRIVKEELVDLTQEQAPS